MAKATGKSKIRSGVNAAIAGKKKRGTRAYASLFAPTSAKAETKAIAKARAKAIKAGARLYYPTAISIDTADKKDGRRVLRFGAVTVSNPVPDADTVVVNVKAGRDALVRAKEALIKPGVKLPHRANIPQFRVDAANPRVMIRELNGRVDRGQIVNGAFVPAE